MVVFYVTEQQEQAYSDYRAGMRRQDIAAKYGVSVNTVDSWRKRHNWSKDGAPKNSAPKKHGAPYGNHNAVGHGAPPGNKNSVGNRGGHPAPGNQNAVRHGLYSKYLTAETVQIIQTIEKAGISEIDLLWDSILLKYSQILRSQKIMNVKDQDDIVKVKKSESDTSLTYEFQFPWDRQASYLHALSASMRTLTTMIKEYDELCKSDLATEEQRLRIEKIKADINSDDDSKQQSASINQLINTLQAARGDKDGV